MKKFPVLDAEAERRRAEMHRPYRSGRYCLESQKSSERERFSLQNSADFVRSEFQLYPINTTLEFKKSHLL